MNIGDTTKTVVSKGKKTTEVIYKVAAYRMKGVMKFISKTKHELNR